ncbi:hypothetical protein RI054_05g29980 [Pseudoscourfieldia marina]
MMAAPTAQAHEATETTATRITEEAKDALRAYFSTLDVVRTSKLPRKGASEVLDNIIISHASLTREKAGWQLRKYKIEQNIITPVDATATQDEIVTGLTHAVRIASSTFGRKLSTSSTTVLSPS